MLLLLSFACLVVLCVGVGGGVGGRVCVCVGGGGGCYVCIWYLPTSSLGLGYDLALQLAFGVSVVLNIDRFKNNRAHSLEFASDLGLHL